MKQIEVTVSYPQSKGGKVKIFSFGQSVQFKSQKNWKTKTSIKKRSNQKQIERKGEITYMTMSCITFIIYNRLGEELSRLNGKFNEGKIFK